MTNRLILKYHRDISRSYLQLNQHKFVIRLFLELKYMVLTEQENSCSFRARLNRNENLH